jgi:WXG100 family type VII secretion target
MSNQEIKVTAEILHSTSASLASGEQEIAGKLSQLHGQVQAPVCHWVHRSWNWKGSASSAFHDLWTQWHTGAQQVQTALTGISQMLSKTGTVYQTTEDTLASDIRHR